MEKSGIEDILLEKCTISLDKCTEGLNKLVSSDYEGDGHEYEAALERRLNILHFWLDKEENASLKLSYEAILKSEEFQLKGACSVSVRLSVSALALLELLRRSLAAARSAGPADPLSLAGRRTAARAVQLTVALCLLPALPAGVGVPPEQRSEFPQLLRSGSGPPSDQYQRRAAAVLAVRRLLPLTADPSLSAAVLPAHAADLLALLLLVADAPLAARLPPERRHQLLAQRRQLAPELAPLLARLSAAAAVSELLLLQRCAAQARPPRRWLHDRCARLIFQYVRRPGGLVTVTEGLLRFWGQDRLDDVPLERLQAVATLLASPHPEFNNEEYFSHLASEVLSLLRLSRQEVRVTTLRVAGCLTAALWQSPAGQAAVQSSLLLPLLSPLSAGRPQPASETELTSGLTAAWQLLVAGSDPASPALAGLVPHAAALLQLHTAVRGGASRLRAPCRELLQRLLRSGQLAEAPRLVEELLLAEGVGERRRFVPGETGGARVEAVPPEEADNWLIEDEALAAAFAEVVAEAAGPQLVSGVFVELLERLRAVAALPGLCGEPAEPESRGEELLAWERRQAEGRRALRRGLLTLRALAALAESEQARAGLEDAERLLPLVQTLLETYCAAGEAGETGQSTEPGLLQAETASLALAVLGGLLAGEPSTAPVWRDARRLLPVLARLAEAEAAAERVRDMARDLHRLVSTNGVVRPAEWCGGTVADLHRAPDQAPAQTRAHDTDQTRGDNPAFLPESAERRQPLITVLSSQDTADPASTPPAATPEPPTPAAESPRPGSAEAPTPAAERPRPGPAEVPTRAAESPRPGPAETPTPAAESPRPGPAASDASGPAEAPSYRRALYDLADPLLPVRAHALTTLGQLLERRDPETCRNRDRLLRVFQEKLSDADSYVYLAAVRGLARLADRFPAEVVSAVCTQLRDRGGPGSGAETRLKLAEALVMVVRNLGDLAPHYAPQLLAALLAGCRDREPLVRASSLSCLGEVCRLLRLSLAAHLQEIFGCLSALLETDPAVEVRRAAVLLVCQLIDGLGADALKVLEAVLLPLYRRLKVLLRREEDPALLQHVRTALDRLETATRQALFPPAPRSLQKRIIVLDPPA